MMVNPNDVDVYQLKNTERPQKTQKYQQPTENQKTAKYKNKS